MKKQASPIHTSETDTKGNFLLFQAVDGALPTDPMKSLNTEPFTGKTNMLKNRLSLIWGQITEE